MQQCAHGRHLEEQQPYEDEKLARLGGVRALDLPREQRHESEDRDIGSDDGEHADHSPCERKRESIQLASAQNIEQTTGSKRRDYRQRNVQTAASTTRIGIDAPASIQRKPLCEQSRWNLAVKWIATHEQAIIRKLMHVVSTIRADLSQNVYCKFSLAANRRQYTTCNVLRKFRLTAKLCVRCSLKALSAVAARAAVRV